MPKYFHTICEIHQFTSLCLWVSDCCLSMLNAFTTQMLYLCIIYGFLTGIVSRPLSKVRPNILPNEPTNNIIHLHLNEYECSLFDIWYDSFTRYISFVCTDNVVLLLFVASFNVFFIFYIHDNMTYWWLWIFSNLLYFKHFVSTKRTFRHKLFFKKTIFVKAYVHHKRH